MSSLLPDIVRPVLARHGLGDWPVHPDGFWCYVGLPAMRARIQGWKLHLSATPLAAPLVLAQAAEVLAQHRCMFKFASTTDNVRTLGSKQAARGAGGKFITVYCDGDDDQLRELAEDLHQATAGLPGPAILSDRPYRPGSLVHYRFGVMRGVQALTDDGRYEAMLVAPDGRLVPDERNAWYSPPKWAPRDPFARPDAKPRATSVRLNDRYVVTEAIRHAFTGGVFRARDEQTGALVIIKQARRHAGGTIGGQDRRDTRRHEAQMLRRFQDSGITPRLVDLFDQQGDLFLVQEAINGVTLRRWTPATLDAVERVARGLVDLMAAVHAEGLVLRDFTPGNVIIDESGTPKLIDLELLAVPGQQVIVGYTPGFAAPEQIVTAQISAAPDFSADLYSLGATLLFLATGTNPPVPERWLDHVSVQNATARRLKAAIVPLLHKDRHQRPSLAEVRALLARSGEPKPLKSAVDIDGVAAAVVKHLIGTMRPDSGELWSLSHLGFRTDPLNVQFGAAGVVGVLTGIRLADPGLVPAQVIATAAQWIARKVNLEPRVLPGLYFGRTGTAWALLDAGTQLGDKELAGIATDLALRVPVEWPNPDVCHGIAGAGLGQLKFWAATGDPAFLARAERIVEALTKTVEREYGLVRWPIPERARNSRHGFAHGVAGIGAFLLAAGRATSRADFLKVATEAAESLAAVALVDGDAAYWASGKKGATAPLAHWCGGSSGVGTFLLRMWQETGDMRYLDLAGKAAVAVRRSQWSADPGQCHGVAGDGEFLLDMHAVSHDERHHEWAHQLATGILLRHNDLTGLPADFSAGSAGVLAFLTRLRHGGTRLWQPEALTLPMTEGGDTHGDRRDRAAGAARAGG